jgi:uncharacterized membrane protein
VTLRGASAKLAHVVVALLIVFYIAIFGTLSLRRHQNLRTNALDLGYTDQAVWNTLHGRPFRFSTYLNAAFVLDIPLQDFRQPDVLLGYHVEPLLAPISLLYLMHDGPETLLWLQTAALALGAIPIYLLARHKYAARTTHLAFGWLPVAFVALYLLSPSLEAANMSDFHAVALSPVLLLSAFYCLETDRPWGFVAFAFLAAMTKEEVGLLVAMMGLWAALVRRRWVLGLGVAAAGFGWSVQCFTVIMPHFSGLGHSAFLVRYGQFGESVTDIVRNLFQQPDLFVDWLRRPAVARYLRDLWLSSGGLAILHPLALLMALPSLAINTFSSYDWMRSGGGHYSATIVPFLVIAAIYGVAWVAGKVGNWKIGRRASDTRILAASLLLVGVGLGVALVHQYHVGISPLSRRFALETVSAHARRSAPLIDWVNALPPETPISAGSNLYPHVAHREHVYLFPTISDAQFILLDVTGPATPVSTGDQRQIVRELLEYGQFGIAASDHGFLLLERDLDEYRLSPTFHQVFLAGDSEPQVPVGADFAGLLRLEGFERYVRPVVRPELVVQIATYWRALVPLEQEYRLAFYFWDKQGHLVHIQPEEQAVHWYATWLWEPGQLVKVTLPPLPVGDLAHVGVAVLLPGAGDRETEGRLVPITSSGGQAISLWEQDTIVELIEP